VPMVRWGNLIVRRLVELVGVRVVEVLILVQVVLPSFITIFGCLSLPVTLLRLGLVVDGVA